MTAALFVSHTAQKGGAELCLIDLVRGGPPDWRGGFLSDGPAAETLAAIGRMPPVLAAGSAMHAVRRDSGLRAAAGASSALARVGRSLAGDARGSQVLVANSQKALFACAIASVLAQRPLVWSLHDILTDPAYSAVNRRAAVAVANRLARRVVANSAATADAFVACGGRADRISVVPNGFDPAAHPVANPADAARLRAAFGFDARPVVTIVARLTPWKGQHVFLDALARTPGVQGLVVGGPLFEDGAYEAALRAQAERLGIAARVRFAGARDDVAALMAGSDVLVHASTAPEPFGRVVV